MTQNKELLDFPCRWPFKILGLNHEDFLPEIIAILSAHDSTFSPQNDVSIKESSNRKYLAVTATIYAHSKAQLDTIYSELHKHKLVKYLL